MGLGGRADPGLAWSDVPDDLPAVQVQGLGAEEPPVELRQPWVAAQRLVLRPRHQFLEEDAAQPRRVERSPRGGDALAGIGTRAGQTAGGQRGEVVATETENGLPVEEAGQEQVAVPLEAGPQGTEVVALRGRDGQQAAEPPGTPVEPVPVGPQDSRRGG